MAPSPTFDDLAEMVRAECTALLERYPGLSGLGVWNQLRRVLHGEGALDLASVKRDVDKPVIEASFGRLVHLFELGDRFHPERQDDLEAVARSVLDPDDLAGVAEKA